MEPYPGLDTRPKHPQSRSWRWLAVLMWIQASAWADPGPVTYVIGVEDIAYYPHYQNDNGEQKGIGSAILDAFCARHGCRFIYKPFPVPRLLNSLLAGDIDFKYPDNRNWRQDRKAGYKIVYSEAIDEYTDGVMVRAGQKGRGISRFHRLGIIRGFTPWAFRDAIDTGLVTVEENRNMEGLLSLVLLGRIDGAYLNINVGRYYLKEHPPQAGNLVFDPSLPYDHDAYVLSTIRHPELIAELNLFLEGNKSLIAKIRARYIDELDATTSEP